MKTTSAIVFINSNGDILGCHAFGKPIDKGWDFPKGLVDEGETDLEAMHRELFEETGYKIINKANIIDAGVLPHNKEKNIHIFVYPTNDMPNIKSLHCSSYFERYGKKFPEVDSFAIIPKIERYKFNKVLQDKFELIDSIKKLVYE